MKDEPMLIAVRPSGPSVSREEIAAVTAVLARADEIIARLDQFAEGEQDAERPKRPAGWLTAREIGAELSTEPKVVTERRVRLIASASNAAIVSFPGSPGYKLLRLCTLEEINHCVESFRSQAAEMNSRAGAYLKAYHRRDAATRSPEQPDQQLALA